MILERGHFVSNKIQKAYVTKSLNEVRTFSAKTAYSSKPTVFISHKHSDLEDIDELRGVIEILEDLGAKIYIDAMDNKMPEETCGDTAKRIKEVIEYCNKFVLLATEKAIESYWCNWELGIGDVHKYKNHIAILPIKEKNTYDRKYKGNEYMQIYSSIEYRDGNSTYRDGSLIPKGYYIRTPVSETYNIIPLKEWLNK